MILLKWTIFSISSKQQVVLSCAVKLLLVYFQILCVGSSDIQSRDSSRRGARTDTGPDNVFCLTVCKEWIHLLWCHVQTTAGATDSINWFIIRWSVYLCDWLACGLVMIELYIASLVTSRAIAVHENWMNIFIHNDF